MRFVRNLSFGVGLALLAFAIAFALITYGPRRYVASYNHSADEALWNSNSLYLTVRSGGFAHSELKGTSRVPLLAGILGVTAGHDFAVLPGELTIFQYAGGQVQKDTLAGRFVQAVPSGDALYFVVTDQAKQRKVFTWEESHLVAVSHDTAQTVLKASDDQSDSDEEDAAPAIPQGWHRSSLYPGRNGARTIDVVLDTAKATIKIEQAKGEPKANAFPVPIVTLEASTLDASVQISGGDFNGTKEITAAEFAALRAKDPSPRPHRSSARAALRLSEYLIYLMIPFSPVLVTLFSILRLKSKLLSNLPEQASFPNALPEQFSALNHSKLDEMTRALENLGFKQLLDYTMVSSMAIQIPAFGRLMVNERSNCYAEINQIFPPRKGPMEMACSFTSRFENGWVISTGTRKPNGGTWIMRLPQSVWRCKLGLDPVSLCQAHQQQCTELTSDLGVRALPTSSASEYFRGVQSRMVQRRTVVRSKMIATILFEYYGFKLRPHLEWQGDWPKEAAKRMGFSAKAAGA
jgi:hypothetical protein